MNKVKNKFLKIFLTLSLLTTVSFATQAKPAEKRFSYGVTFTYKDKDLEKDQNVDKKTQDNPFRKLKNKTNAKEIINFNAVMQKLFEKYNIPIDDALENPKRLNIKTLTPVSKELKLTGDFTFAAKTSKEEKAFKNLFNNFNNDVKNITITKKDFEDTQKQLIDKIKNDIKKLEDKIKDFKDYDVKETKDENLIKIGRISANRMIKQTKKAKSETKNKKELKDLNKTIAYHKEILKDDKKAKEEGKWARNLIGNYREVLLPNMKKHIEQLKNVKYEDVKDLTKELKIDVNSLNKQKYFEPFKLESL